MVSLMSDLICDFVVSVMVYFAVNLMVCFNFNVMVELYCESNCQFYG